MQATLRPQKRSLSGHRHSFNRRAFVGCSAAMRNQEKYYASYAFTMEPCRKSPHCLMFFTRRGATKSTTESSALPRSRPEVGERYETNRCCIFPPCHDPHHAQALAAVLDGASREEAAKIGGMDRQTLRDWVIRYNEQGPDGLDQHPFARRAAQARRHAQSLSPSARGRRPDPCDPRRGAGRGPAI